MPHLDVLRKMKHIFQPTALILVVGLSTNLLAGEFLAKEADPKITIKSVGPDPDNPKLLSVSVTMEAIGHGPVALAQDQFSVSISTQNEPYLFSSDAIFPATTAKTIKIEPDNPLTVTIKVDKNRFGMKESWSALQKGVYELQIRVNSGKSRDFDYQWLGQTYSKARKIKIPMAEQVVAPNRSLPPSQISTSPVRGSED